MYNVGDFLYMHFVWWFESFECFVWMSWTAAPRFLVHGRRMRPKGETRGWLRFHCFYSFSDRLDHCHLLSAVLSPTQAAVAMCIISNGRRMKSWPFWCFLEQHFEYPGIKTMCQVSRMCFGHAMSNIFEYFWNNIMPHNFIVHPYLDST